MAKLRTVWTQRAKAQLKQIQDYLKYEKKTPQGAANVRRDLINASKGVTFVDQYQRDESNPNYRRIVVRHYKLIYKEDKGRIIILRVFDTLQDPDKLLKGNE